MCVFFFFFFFFPLMIVYSFEGYGRAVRVQTLLLCRSAFKYADRNWSHPVVGNEIATLGHYSSRLMIYSFIPILTWLDTPFWILYTVNIPMTKSFSLVTHQGKNHCLFDKLPRRMGWCCSRCWEAKLPTFIMGRPQGKLHFCDPELGTTHHYKRVRLSYPKKNS